MGGTVFSLFYIWLIAGLLLAIGEIFIPSFAVMCLAIGAFGASVTDYFNYNWQSQIWVFSGLSLLSVFTIRPLALKFLYRSQEKIATGVEALMGKTAKVIEEIPGNMEKGRIKIEGEKWNAISRVDLPIPVGSRVVIREVDGNKLIVEMAKD